MPLAVVQGDQGGPYVYPSVPPVYASFVALGGSVKTFFNGRSVLLLGQALMAGGPIITSTLMSTKTLVEGRPVLLVGSVTNLGTGWLGGILQAGSAPNVIVS